MRKRLGIGFAKIVLLLTRCFIHAGRFQTHHHRQLRVRTHGGFETDYNSHTMNYILSLDQGTTSSRALVFDHAGRVVATAQTPFAQHFHHAGWVEHDANEIWTTQLAMARQAIAAASAAVGADVLAQIAAIGITNQRETTVLWDRATGEPIAPAIVWQDRRTAAACDTLRTAGKAAMIVEKTGLVLDAYFSATKLAWLLEHTPHARARAEAGELCFGTVDSWLVFKLTGGRVHATDVSNASRTLLCNIHTLQWDAALLALFNIPPAVLPTIVASSGVVGDTDAALLGRSLPIAGMAGDQQAATFGQTCFAPGTAKNTYGTGCFMLMNTGAAPVLSRNKLLTTVGWQGGAGQSQVPHNTAYCLEGSVFMGGATVQWLRDGLGLIAQASDIEALAASVANTDDVYLVPAFAGLGAPHWDGYARGALVGMTRGTGRGHIARAALEAIALQSADVFSAMRADSGIALKELRVDGGASNNNLLMQLQADYLGVPVVRPVVTETTALGAAYLAGLAVGFWADAGEISRQWAVDRRFEPALSDAARGEKLARWHQALERSKGWAR
jgi:glycerol kinase